MEAETLEGILQGRVGEPHELIEAFHDIQEVVGYLPEDAIRATADRLGVHVLEAYRVANFYKAFVLEPRGEHLITVCMGTACHVRGAPRMLDEVAGQLGIQPGETTDDGLFTLECVNCLGACALGPLVVMDGVYHDHMTPGKLRGLTEQVRNEEKQVTADG